MAPPVAYERQACLGIYTTHVKIQHDTAIMQQSIKTRETQHEQNLCYTVKSPITKKHFNTFVITQLEFGQAPSIVVRP